MLYTTVGFSSALDVGVPPGKDQLNVVAFAEEPLVNSTVRGPHPLPGDAVKPAVGGVTIVIVSVKVLVPQGLVAVKVTV